MSDTKEKLSFVDKTLEKADYYSHAVHVLNYDMETICPKKARQKEGELIALTSNEAFKILKNKKFIAAGEDIFAHKDELDPLDKVLAEHLHRSYVVNKNITPGLNKKFSLTFNKAYVDWLEAKEKSDFSLFAPSLKKVRDVQDKIYNLRDDKTSFSTPYNSMLDGCEKGMDEATLDAFFGECKARLIPLLKRINSAPKKIRTDFLSRKVSVERQAKFNQYLMPLIGFDLDRGALTTTEHPFTDGLAKDDVRITTHYYEDNFISNIFSVIHEGGHAIFEQNQNEEDFAHHINENMSMGMHESVSRFYENRIGRSKAFVHLIFPKLQADFSDIFSDVTEEEFYEGINAVQPSFVRTEADEFTYTFHIIIRYEIEKEMVDNKLPTSQVRKLWNQKYKDYLGIVPPNDTLGVLQDVHWSSNGFGYFPTYALGNAYNAMYYNRMKKEIDIDKEVESGNFANINRWMKDNVFNHANRLDYKAWLMEITGRSFTPDDFLDYLEDKYTKMYNLK